MINFEYLIIIHSGINSVYLYNKSLISDYILRPTPVMYCDYIYIYQMDIIPPPNRPVSGVVGVFFT